MRTHIGLHFQSDGEDAGHDVPARKSGAGSGESEAVRRIGQWVRVRQWLGCLQHIAFGILSVTRSGSRQGEEHYLLSGETFGGAIGGAAMAERAPAIGISSGMRFENILLSP